MKPFIALALLLPIVAACGKKDQPAAPAPAPETVSQPTPVAPPPSPEEVKPSEASAAKVGGSVYVIAKGDTLYSIAKKHGLKHQDLAKWNDIKDPRRIRIGQELALAPPAK